MQSMAATSFCGVTAQAANLRIDHGQVYGNVRGETCFQHQLEFLCNIPRQRCCGRNRWSAEADSLEQSQGKTGDYPKCGGVYERSERWRNHLQFSHRVSKRADTNSWLGILCQCDASIWVRLPVASWSKRLNLLLRK